MSAIYGSGGVLHMFIYRRTKGQNWDHIWRSAYSLDIQRVIRVGSFTTLRHERQSSVNELTLMNDTLSKPGKLHHPILPHPTHHHPLITLTLLVMGQLKKWMRMNPMMHHPIHQIHLLSNHQYCRMNSSTQTLMMMRMMKRHRFKRRMIDPWPLDGQSEIDNLLVNGGKLGKPLQSYHQIQRVMIMALMVKRRKHLWLTIQSHLLMHRQWQGLTLTNGRMLWMLK